MLLRMRGAGRHEVEDVSFGFVFSEAEPQLPSDPAELIPTTHALPPTPRVPSPPAAPRSANPNTSAKRRRINPPEPATGNKVPRRKSGERDVYDIPDHTTEDTQSVRTALTATTATLAVVPPTTNDDGEDGDELESLPRPTPVQSNGRGSVELSRTRLSTQVIDNFVSESPADAPGSGRRERVVVAPASSVALQRAVMSQQQSPDEEDEISALAGVEASSPLVRQVERRKSAARRSVANSENKRLSDGSARFSAASASLGEIDELSPVGGSQRSGRLSGQSLPGDRSAGRRTSVRLSVASAPGEVDELSPERVPESGILSATKEKTPSKARKSRMRAVKLPATESKKNRRTPKRKSSPVFEPEQPEDEPGEEQTTQQAAAKSPERQSKKKQGKAKRKPSPVPAQEEPEDSEELEEEQPEEQVSEEPQEPEEPEEAEEIHEIEAAQRLGRKRPRRSLIAPGSPDQEKQQPEGEEEPAAKRRRNEGPPQSPASQQRPKTKKEKRQQAAEKSKKPTAKRKTKAPGEDGEDELQGGSVPVVVQRFTKKVRLENADGEEGTDILALGSAIPFANRAGVNAVDVLSQMCDEMIDGLLTNLTEKASAAEDTTNRREFRTMTRALEAFREELRLRLLEHTIALDTLYALQKRVKATQKTKLALRQEILEIRAEREQVALKMDAVRIKHEEESKGVLVCSHCLSYRQSCYTNSLAGTYQPLLHNARHRLGR